MQRICSDLWILVAMIWIPFSTCALPGELLVSLLEYYAGIVFLRKLAPRIWICSRKRASVYITGRLPELLFDWLMLLVLCLITIISVQYSLCVSEGCFCSWNIKSIFHLDTNRLKASQSQNCFCNLMKASSLYGSASVCYLPQFSFFVLFL